MGAPFRRTAAIGTLALACIAPRVASAQRPAGADTLSPAAVAESLKVLNDIRALLDKRKNQNNADLWYHRGMLTWALYLRDRAHGGLRELDWTMLGRELDSSLRLASELAPNNVRYQLTKGQYFLSTGWLLVTVQSLHVFDAALERARKSGDPQLIAEAAIERGRVHWRRYGGVAAQPVSPTVYADGRTLGGPTLGNTELLNRDLINYNPRNIPAMSSLLDGRDFYGRPFPRAHGEFSGEIDYYKAEEFFREAYRAKPSFLRAFTSLAMLLEARQRWTELAALARERIADEPHHAWAWLTLGMTLHRTGNSIGALAAFDSGLKYLDPGARRRLDDIARVMRPSDSPVVRGWSTADRKQFEDWYWIWAAPLWSLEETRPRAEFLARLTAAELRWTVDDFGKKGADTDRGNVFVRYGPSNGGRAGFGAESWWYNYTGLAFYFDGVPGFGTAYFGNPAEAMSLMDSIPARWDNLLRVRVDSMPLRVARFRVGSSAHDSLDIVFAMAPPVDSIRQSAELDTPVHLNTWLFNDGFPRPQHDSLDLRADSALLVARRVPEGAYLYRAEVTHETALRGARSSARVWAKADSADEFYTKGFGVSDLLVGSRAIPRGVPQRWTDFDFTPAPGDFHQGSTLALVWENYDLAERDGTAQYAVKLTIEHKWQMVLNRLRARVISAFAAMMGTDQTPDRVIFRYDRTTPHAAIVPDYITIELADTPEGYYDVTLEITDKVSGRVTSRTTRIRIGG